MARIAMITLLLFASVGGCATRGEMYDAFETLRTNPTPRNTASFLAYGDQAVRFLEQLPEDERKARITAQDQYDATTIIGEAPKGMLRVRIERFTNVVVIDLPLSEIRVIRFLKPSAGGSTDDVKGTSEAEVRRGGNAHAKGGQ